MNDMAPNFHLIRVDQIKVDRENRQRRDLIGIEELADSILRIGLLHPVVIDDEYNLLAGERRYTAITNILKWETIPVHFKRELSDTDRMVVELEENIRRVDISWQDRCRAIKSYRDRRREQGAEDNDIITSLGISRNSFYDQIAVAENLEGGAPKIAEAPRFSTARNQIRRDRARNAAKALEDIIAPSIEAEAAPAKEPTGPIVNADFSEWAATYSGPRFNFIHCDFPYGIGADTMEQGGGASYGRYADTFEVYQKNLDTLEKNLERIAAQDCHLMFWFSMQHYEFTRKRLEAMGWWVNYMPYIWHRSDGAGIIPDPNRRARQVYETALFGVRGDLPLVIAKANLFSAPTVSRGDRIHMSEKPAAMLDHFFSMLVGPTTSLLDPTAGSGSAVRAARRGGAERFVGIELEPEFARLANEAFKKEFPDG